MTKLLLLIFILSSSLCNAQTAGPESGSLVVVGGGMQDLTILQRFANLAGGSDAPIVVIPTAGGDNQYDQNWPGLSQFKQAGLTNLTLIHTYDLSLIHI